MREEARDHARPVTSTSVPDRTVVPARASGPGRVVLAVVVGLLVGAATSGAQTLLGATALAGLANAVSPWLLAPFFVAAWCTCATTAAVVGVLACCTQVVGYYVVSDARGFGVHLPTVGVWLVAGVLGGAVVGWAGWSWRVADGRLRGLGPALLVAAWLCEGVVVFGVVLGYPDSAAVSVIVGLLLAAVLGRRDRQYMRLAVWLVPALAAGALGFVAAVALL